MHNLHVVYVLFVTIAIDCCKRVLISAPLKLRHYGAIQIHLLFIVIKIYYYCQLHYI